jgi:hypothetical protein
MMTRDRLLSLVASCLATLLAAPGARADVVVKTAVQVGGFYDSSDGYVPPDNSPTGPQNYFVGYGSISGGGRTPERRSFFHFSLGGVSGVINSATLKLKLVIPGGLHFGISPGPPASSPPPDAHETFQLGVSPVPVPALTASGMPKMTSDAIFASFAAMDVAGPLTFLHASPPADGFIDIPLTAAGLGVLTANAGGDLVLTGWMPSFSKDTRITPGSMPPEFFEGSELIFGLTDVSAGFAKPELTIDFTPAAVPEASGLLLVGAIALTSLAVVKFRRTARIASPIK